MKHGLLGLATVLLGAAVVLAAGRAATGEDLRPVQPLGITWGCVLIAAGGLMMLAPLRGLPHRTVLPLNWFLPALRTQPRGAGAASRLERALRCLLPAFVFSDRVTKQRGWARRTLRQLGISWVSTPLRRIVQAACFVLFLVLFFWVCWPYSARPQPPGRVSENWRLGELGSSDGTIPFSAAAVPDWISPGRQVHVVDQGQTEDGYLAPFAVRAASANQVVLEPARELTEQQLDQLLTAFGPWALHEREPASWPTHYADDLAAKEFVPADLFLVIDPLVSLSTAIASRNWVWSLSCAAIILIVCVLIPRGFCGYICPLGTLIDLFDWAIGRRISVWRVPADGWWVHIKYYLLLGTLLCAAFGVLVSGYIAAIPVITRGMLFLGEPLQSGGLRGWHLVPAQSWPHLCSVLLFLGVLGLGLLQPRFWCKYVCPSGATFSLANLFRISERKVESSCIHCNKCVEVCPFDAIKPDFTTRVSDCTLCQTCGGVCPTHAIKFVERWNTVQLKVAGVPETGEGALGRRDFLSLAAGTAAAVVGAAGVATGTKAWGAQLSDPTAWRPVRPPGSVPEAEFLQMCIRCGECFKACPNNVLQAEGVQQGLEGLWTPLVVADWAGCESSCNACGQVCPTGAIRALPIEEKKAARMGLAIVDQTTCLPFADQEACQLCVDECNAAGYEAIEFTRVHTRVDEQGNPLADSGYVAPVVLADKCVGCGLCQTRCFAINVKDKKLLSESAIVIEAGPGKEDRLMSGSYVQLRAAERRQQAPPTPPANDGFFIPQLDSAEPPATAPEEDSDNPFGH